MNLNRKKHRTVITCSNSETNNKKHKLVKIPATSAGISATITTDVLKYDIPLLLNKEAMKKAYNHID